MVSIGGSQGSSEPTRVSNWTKEQKAVFRDLYPMISKGLLQEGGATAYPGKMYVARTPEEEAYFKAVGGDLPDYLKSRQTALDSVLSGNPAYNITPETTEEFYQQAVRNPALREFEQITKPAITESFAGPGYWGSARAQEESRASENLASELSARRATLGYEDEHARRAALESAAGRQAATALPAYQAGIEQLGSAGQYARMIEQEKVASDFQRWLSGETVDGVTPDQYNPYLQLAFQLLGMSAFSIGNKSSSTSLNLGIG